MVIGKQYMAFWVAMLVGLYWAIKLAGIAVHRAIDYDEIITLPELLTILVTLIVVAIIMKWG